MGVIQCLNLSGKHPYGVLALLIASTCVLVLLNKYCHFLIDLRVYFSALLFLPNYAWGTGRNELFIYAFLTGALSGPAWEGLALIMKVHYGLLIYIYLNQYYLCQLWSVKKCFNWHHPCFQGKSQMWTQCKLLYSAFGMFLNISCRNTYHPDAEGITYGTRQTLKGITQKQTKPVRFKMKILWVGWWSGLSEGNKGSPVISWTNLITRLLCLNLPKVTKTLSIKIRRA